MLSLRILAVNSSSDSVLSFLDNCGLGPRLLFELGEEDLPSRFFGGEAERTADSVGDTA